MQSSCMGPGVKLKSWAIAALHVTIAGAILSCQSRPSPHCSTLRLLEGGRAPLLPCSRSAPWQGSSNPKQVCAPALQRLLSCPPPPPPPPPATTQPPPLQPCPDTHACYPCCAVWASRQAYKCSGRSSQQAVQLSSCTAEQLPAEMEDESLPLSQLANEAFNPTAPHDFSNEGPVAGARHGPTDFAGLATSLTGSGSGNAANGSDAAAAAAGPGPGPGSAAQRRLGKGGKLFNVRGWMWLLSGFVLLFTCAAQRCLRSTSAAPTQRSLPSMLMLPASQDPIHGAFRLDPASTLMFDTRQFQRLRRLKQVGRWGWCTECSWRALTAVSRVVNSPVCSSGCAAAGR